MAERRGDRIDKLSQRLHRHATGRPPTTTPRRRERCSFYLDGELTHHLDTTYRQLAHQLHPQTTPKPVFLETLLEFGLDRLPEPHHRSAGRDTDIANLLPLLPL